MPLKPENYHLQDGPLGPGFYPQAKQGAVSCAESLLADAGELLSMY